MYLQVIADACVEIAVLEICSEKNTRKSILGTFKNICTVAVHCWYIKDGVWGLGESVKKEKLAAKIFFR